MPHVQATCHIGWWQHDAIGFSTVLDVILGREVIFLLPIFVAIGFYCFGLVGFIHRYKKFYLGLNDMKPYYWEAYCPHADCLEQSLLEILRLLFFVGDDINQLFVFIDCFKRLF